MRLFRVKSRYSIEPVGTSQYRVSLARCWMGIPLAYIGYFERDTRNFIYSGEWRNRYMCIEAGGDRWETVREAAANLQRAIWHCGHRVKNQRRHTQAVNAHSRNKTIYVPPWPKEQ